MSPGGLVICALACECPSSDIVVAWIDGKPVEVSARAIDGEVATWAELVPGRADGEVAFGFEWQEARAVHGLLVKFIAINGHDYCGRPDAQHLEINDGRNWHKVESVLGVDFGERTSFARHQAFGFVTWDWRCSSAEAHGVRVVLSGTQSSVPWHARYVVSEIGLRPRGHDGDPGNPGEERPPQEFQESSEVIEEPPEWTTLHGEQGADLFCTRPMLVNCIEIHGPRGAGDVSMPSWVIERWDGRGFRPLEAAIEKEQRSDRDVWVARFAPTVVRRLRVGGLTESMRVVPILDSRAMQYFSQVQQGRTDLLMQRLKSPPGDPDYASAASLLLPLDFQVAVCGRPFDPAECIVRWNGTFSEIEHADEGWWIAGAQTSAGSRIAWVDRWFGFTAEEELFGTRPEAAERTLIDGYLPGVVTRYRKNGVEYSAEVLTTSPDDEAYAIVVKLSALNQCDGGREARCALIMGRRRSHHSGQSWESGQAPGPMRYVPLTTGYGWSAADHTLRDDGGNVVLVADEDGVFGGGDLEPSLSYEWSLESGESHAVHFLIPSVNGPVRSLDPLRGVDAGNRRSRYQRFWTELLGRVEVEIPEAPLNDLWKSLVAQSLIVLFDEDRLKYGAYVYEDYFGIEEGWPLHALAQFGQAEAAQRGIETMLSQELLDKSNYHHQYRTGLAPMYASQVYRLTRDRGFLGRIRPRLLDCARWIVESRHDDQGKPESCKGLLPRHAYGGDITAKAFSLYSNATCWRGLTEIAFLLRELGDTELAQAYRRDANDYRSTILEIARRHADRNASPPFVPLAFEIEGVGAVERAYEFLPEDDLGNYWNLFAPLALETGTFAADGDVASWMRGTMEQHGGLLCGLARFHGGIDPIYGFGYPMQLAECGAREQFLAAAYGFLALALARDSFTGGEVTGMFPLRTDNEVWRDRMIASMWEWNQYATAFSSKGFSLALGSEPLSASAGVALQLIRRMLVHEKTDENLDFTGTLELLPLAPEHWLEDGSSIVLKGMPTAFGPFDLRVRSRLAQDQIEVEWKAPTRNPPFEVRLHLWMPGSRKIHAALDEQGGKVPFHVNQVLLPSAGAANVRLELAPR